MTDNHRYIRSLSLALCVAVLVGLAAVAYAFLAPQYSTAPTAYRPTATAATDSQPSPATNTQATLESDRLAPIDTRVRLKLWGWKLDVYALGWFMATLALIAIQNRVAQPLARRLTGYLFALATVGLAGAIWALYAVGFNGRLVAFEYRVAIVSVGVTFVLAGLLPNAGFRAILPNLAGDTTRILTSRIAWVAVVGFATLLVLEPQPGSATSALTGRAFDQWLASQERALELRPDDGVPEVTILKFNDYQCPPCQRAWLEHSEMISNMVRTHQDIVTFRAVDLPWETECNRYVSLDRHDAACEAAAAMRMAASTGKASQLEAWLWENQTSLSRERVAEAAASIAGVHNFWQEYEGTLELVRQDVELGRRLGVLGTPTYFVNGIRLPPGVSSSDFQRAIEAEVQRVRMVTHDERKP